MKLDRHMIKLVIEKFLNEGGATWEWDDFISTPISDKYLNSIRLVCLYLPEAFPPEEGSNYYCSERGLAALKCIQQDLLP
jgi:hypothetical protein